jgi:ABC-type Fe3+-siderophore transport system permease subunit
MNVTLPWLRLELGRRWRSLAVLASLVGLTVPQSRVVVVTRARVLVAAGLLFGVLLGLALDRAARLCTADVLRAE